MSNHYHLRRGAAVAFLLFGLPPAGSAQKTPRLPTKTAPPKPSPVSETWSEPQNGLRARVILTRKKGYFVADLEVQNVGRYPLAFSDHPNVDVELHDARDKTVPSTGIGVASGFTPPQLAVITTRGIMRFRLGEPDRNALPRTPAFGLGVSGNTWALAPGRYTLYVRLSAPTPLPPLTHTAEGQPLAAPADLASGQGILPLAPVPITITTADVARPR